MATLVFSLCAGIVYAAVPGPVTVGSLDQKNGPAEKQLEKPATDDGLAEVNLRATVEGVVGDHGKAKLYVLVNPLSNEETWNVWWVQESVRQSDGKFRCSCQFGEGSEGAGEYFAVVAIATDKELTVGEQLRGVPRAAAYSKLKVVKRTR